MATNKTAFAAVHPGSVLKAELKERGISQKEFAPQIGMGASHLSELLNGKRPFTIAIADKLEEVLGIDSQSWMNLQTQYAYDSKKLSEIEAEKEIVLEVSLSDPSMIAEIKNAISLLRGVSKVAIA